MIVTRATDHTYCIYRCLTFVPPLFWGLSTCSFEGEEEGGGWSRDQDELGGIKLLLLDKDKWVDFPRFWGKLEQLQIPHAERFDVVDSRFRVLVVLDWERPMVAGGGGFVERYGYAVL